MNNTDRKGQYKRLLRLVIIIVMLMIWTFAFYKVWMRYYSQGLWLEPFFARGNLFMGFLYMIVQLLFLKIYGGTKIGYYRWANVALSHGIAAFLGNFVSYVEIFLLYRHLPGIWPIFWLTVGETSFAIIYDFIMDAILNKLFGQRNLLLIYDKYDPKELISKFSLRKDKFHIAESISTEHGLKPVYQKIRNYSDGGVLLHSIDGNSRSKILKYCYHKNIRVYMEPKTTDILIREAEQLHLFDTPLLLLRNSQLSIDQMFIKRMMDVTLAIILLVVLAPFMLLTGLAIFLYDGFPVIFKQKRLTINGKVFHLYKFRSMVVDAEKKGEARLATKDDDRITPIGKFIRMTRLDETPQLINVILGDMSLVGPRPERPELARKYCEEIPEFEFRLKVKAGLTGYAQIFGKYNTTIYDKLKLDMMYIENYSFILDIKLILMTFKVLFLKDSAEGITPDSEENSEIMEEGPDLFEEE